MREEKQNGVKQEMKTKMRLGTILHAEHEEVAISVRFHGDGSLLQCVRDMGGARKNIMTLVVASRGVVATVTPDSVLTLPPKSIPPLSRLRARAPIQPRNPRRKNT